MISENSIEISNIKIVKDAVEIDMSGVNIEIQGGEPVYEKLEVTSNGTYTPTGETDAFNEVVVSVPERVPVLESIIIGENGLYTPTADIDGYNEIIVTVPARVPVLENIEVTENGTYTASDGYDGLGEVVVDVKAEGENPYELLSKMVLAEHTGTYEINDDNWVFNELLQDHKIKVGAFYHDTNITGVRLNKVTVIDKYAFYHDANYSTAPSIKYLRSNSLKTLEERAFYYARNLKEIDIPNCTYIGKYTFSYLGYNLTNKLDINLPKVNTLDTYAFNYARLNSIDLGVCSSISASTFNYSTISKIILRYNGICKLANVSAFNNTPIKTSTTSGFIYVPDDLVESYKTATNWVTYASKIKPLSELEV